MKNKTLPKTAIKMRDKLCGSVPKNNTYAGDRKPIKKR